MSEKNPSDLQPEVGRNIKKGQGEKNQFKGDAYNLWCLKWHCMATLTQPMTFWKVGLGTLPFKSLGLIRLFSFWKKCITFLKSDRHLQKIYFLHKGWELSIYQQILRKMYHGFHKNILSSTTVFNTDNNKKCLFSLFYVYQISILEWFLKDHVTLRNGVMAAENSVYITGKNYIWKNINQFNRTFEQNCTCFSGQWRTLFKVCMIHFTFKTIKQSVHTHFYSRGTDLESCVCVYLCV